MGKGERARGKGEGNGVRPVVLQGMPERGGKLAAAFRRERLRFCGCCVSFCLSQKLAEERVVEPVSPSSCADQ